MYELLEIDTPEDMGYFEQLADLLETEGYIDEDLFADALSKVEAETAGDFAENYIKEITDALPESGAEDLTECLESMTQRLQLLAQDIEDKQARADFTVEMYKFRNWLHKESGTKIDGQPATMLQAITELRASKMGLVKHDFSLFLFPELVPEELSYNIGSFDKIDI